ncbi:MAG: NAD-dependent epimerase/dehydratase family protein [Candidatus Aminicenantes bacterium]|nr:MAG: NAD-dependent epimerase/dehydratase family protein [Candidatus Aminicenantes bacterium]
MRVVTSKIALVTGGNGFLGTYIARCFIENGYRVVIIDMVPPGESKSCRSFTYHRLRLPNNKIGHLLRKYSPEICIHCVGPVSIKQSVAKPEADFHNSTVITFNILNALRLNAPESRFVFLSSAAIYGNPASLPVTEEHNPAPISPYGFHKLQCERLCKEFSDVYGVKSAIARIFSAYGEGLRRQVVWDIVRKMLTKRNVILQGTGKESRDFIHAHDVAQGIFLISKTSMLTCETYNLASGDETSISSLAKMILDGLRRKDMYIFDNHLPNGVPKNWRADISKLNKLKFTLSISLRKGVQNFIEWAKYDLALPHRR